jgi:hypothetical protein
LKFTVNNHEKYELEYYISDWHWDQKSHALANELGAFIFGFFDYLLASGVSDRSFRKHRENAWSIGILTCQYGYYEAFSLDMITKPPCFEYEFSRKMSDSKYSLQSYQATCNKLYAYKKNKEYKNLVQSTPDFHEWLGDFLYGLRLFLPRESRVSKKPSNLYWEKELELIYNLNLHTPTAVENKELLSEKLRELVENLEKIAVKLADFPVEKSYRDLFLRDNLLADLQLIKKVAANS